MKYLTHRIIGLMLVAFLSGNAQAQGVFTKYGPVAGIQKSTGATFQNTAAASVDVRALWSGTCSASTYLDGSGACSTPSGVTPTGAANLVFATPNGGSGAATLRALVAGDIAPINLGSTANGGVLSTSILLGTNGGTSNGFFSITGPATSLKTFTFPNASATVLTTNALVTVPQGGTGVGTLTGLVKGNGTSAFTAAASSDVIALWSGTCSSTTFLRGDGACASAGGGAVGGANTNVQFNNSGVFGGDSGFTYAGASGAVGIAGILNLNHSGSVAAGALLLSVASQADLTWQVTSAAADQKNWDITTSTTQMVARACNDALSACRTIWDATRSGVGITAMTIGNTTDQPTVTIPTAQATLNNTATNFNPLSVCANGQTSGQRCWVWRVGGAGDLSLSPGSDAGVPTTANSIFDFVRGAGSAISEIDIGNSTNPTTLRGNGVNMTPQDGTFTMSYTGFTSPPGLTASYYVAGNVVTLIIPGSAVAASNATTFGSAALPAALRPAQSQTYVLNPTSCEDNGAIGGFTCSVTVGSSVLTFQKNGSSSGWTASGQKGITSNVVITYYLN